MFAIKRVLYRGKRVDTGTIEVIPKTVGQYAGLIDKNEKKIRS